MKRKYQRLFSNCGPKGGRPRIDRQIRELIINLKKENPNFGCPQIAAIVFDRTGIKVGIETVRRILQQSLDKDPGNGPSWLTFLGHQADSLWSIDMFRVESILLKTHWVLVVMDQFSRKIIGFAATEGAVTGEGLCYMFNRISAGKTPPKRLSRDNGPLFKFHRWITNVKILAIDEVHSVPFAPTSHPFVERLIGTTRREFVDQILFWNQRDLERKLRKYEAYFNEARVHQGILGEVPGSKYNGRQSLKVDAENLVWQKYCGGLFSVPKAA